MSWTNNEFSLLVAVLALDTGAVRAEVSCLLQLRTIFTMIVRRYPTPSAMRNDLRRALTGGVRPVSSR